MRVLAFFVTALCAAALSLSCSSPFDLELGDRTEPLARTSIGADVLGWESHTAMPVAVKAATAAADGSRIYVLGGATAPGVQTRANQVYNPTEDSWTTGADMPAPARGFAMAATMADGIHVVGGVSSGTTLSDHHVYDPTTDTWSTRASLPRAENAAVAEVVAGKLYTIAGGVLAGDPGAVFIYDPLTDSWSRGTSMPSPRINAASAVIDGMIYVAGGSEFGGTVTWDVLERYDPATDSWEMLASMPALRSALGGGVINGYFCVFGGRLANPSPTGDAFPETFCYDPATDTWDNGPDMLTPRVEIASAELGGAIYAFAGRTHEEMVTAVAERLTPGAIQVEIDVKPGSDDNTINVNSEGVIPVAILTTDMFDATTVDPLSVQFGPAGATEVHNKGHIEDVDGDGDMDLVLHFRTQETGIGCGDTSVTLLGETYSGESIEGTDAIRTVGCG